MNLDKMSDEELDSLMIEELQADEGPSDAELDSMIMREFEDERSMKPELEAGLEGFGKEATFGYLPELQAGAYQAIEEGADVLGLLPEGYEKETYDQSLIDMNNRQKSLEEQSPYAFGAGQVGGTFAGLPVLGVGGATRAVAKGSGAAANLAKGALGQGGLGTRLAGGGTVAGLEGLAYNTEGGIEQRLQNAGASAVLGGAGGEAVMGALKGIPRLVKAAQGTSEWVGRKLMSTTLGVDEDNILKYLRNPELIKEAKTEDEIIDAISDIVRPIREEAAAAEITKDEAVKRLKQAEEVLAVEFRDKGKELSNAFSREAKELSRSVDSSIDQMNRVPPPVHLTDSVVDSLNTLKKQVTQGSREATDALVNEVPGPIPINGALEVLEDSLDTLTIRGKVPTFVEGPAKQIREMADDLREYGDEMSAFEIKKYIKQLDQSIQVAEEAGSFSDATTKSKVALRQFMDKKIKEVSPTYQTMMQAVAEDAELLSQARKTFGKPERARSALSNILSPNKVEARGTLERLAQRTGKNFQESLYEYQAVKNELAQYAIESKRLGKESTRVAKEQFNFDRFETAKAQLDRFKARNKLDNDALQQRILRDTRVKQEAEQAIQRNEMAQEAMDQVGSINDLNAADKVSALVKFHNLGKNGARMKARQELERLSALSDQDFARQIEALALVSSFDKSFLRGSRNVNLWASLGNVGENLFSGRSAMGSAAGGVLGMGPAGIAVGAAMGAMIDAYGPRIARKILDQIITIRGLPTVQKINNLALPENVKRELSEGLRLFAYAEMSQTPVKVAPEDLPAVKEDIMRNGNMSNSDKAKKISSLNRNGTIVSPNTIYTLEEDVPGPGKEGWGKEASVDRESLLKMLSENVQ